jgi:glycosyltransferase involved in cell wall biosynthesis
LIPTAYVSDATVSAMSDYNRKFQLLSAGLKRSAEALERAAINTSILTAYPSTWALESALHDYGASPHKTLLIHWGANMEPSHGAASAVRPDRPFRLLFVGVDWVWKGGDILLRTFQGLRNRGYDVELDVVGSFPSDPPPAIPGVTFHGFISKISQDGRDRLEVLFRRAHLLIFPTQFEALGIVSAESAAFGVPVIAYRTGGVPANIKDGQTGVLIEEGALPEVFVEAVAALIEDPAGRQRMGERAIEFSQEHLNWDAWAKSLVSAIRTALSDASAKEPQA